MALVQQSFDPPFRDAVVERSGLLSQAWTWFFRSVYDRLYPLGVEKSFTLANNQSSAANIDGLKFNPRGVTCVFFEYLVQRITTGSGAVEHTEVGLLVFVYNPTSETWSKVTISEHNPDDAGVVFSIATTAKVGQVQYTTSNIGGTASISSVWYRARTLAGKNALYSSVGGR